ncbi:MAG: Extracellular solute-binding protein family 1, partial [candidate division WS6 bacterium GW2011_GWA2_37_6]
STISRKSFESAFYPIVNSDLVRDGQPYAIPLGMDSLALIYNKDLMSAKGYTTPSDDWTELFEQAQNLTQKTATGTTYQRVGLSLGADEDSNEFWFDIFNLLLMQSGVQMLNSTEDAAVFASDSATQDAVEYFQSYEDEELWNASVKKDVALFLEKKLAMYIAPSWRLLDLVAYNDTYDLGLDIGIAPLPQLSSLEEEQVGWSTYWAQGVSIDSQYYKVGWDFLNFATQQEQLRLVFEHVTEDGTRAFGQIYPRKDMKSEMDSNEYLSVYADEVSTSKGWNMVDGGKVRDVFKEWLNSEIDAEDAQGQVSLIITDQGLLTSEP